MDRQQQEDEWLERVHQRGGAELTLRSLFTGALLGGLLSLTNLYVSAKAGATFGMGVTASLLAYFVFAAGSRVWRHRPLGVLENNIVQTVAGSAGYMASAMTSSLAAYMILQEQIPLWWQVALWVMALAALGMILAIPFKRQFVNDLRYPFPEGQACSVVLSTLHDCPLPSGDRQTVAPRGDTSRCFDASRTLAARFLLASGVAGAILKLLQSELLLQKVHMRFAYLPEAIDEWCDRFAVRWQWWIPEIAGISLRELTIRPTLDVAMFAVGGLMGIRLGISLLLGAVINYVLLVPWMVSRGDIAAATEVGQTITLGFRSISAWSLWSGVALMMTASITALVVRAGTSVQAMRSLTSLWRGRGADPSREIEIPLHWFWIGFVLIVSAIVALSAPIWGVSGWLVVATLPLVVVLVLLGIHSTALTSITPTGAMARVSQLAAGVLAPRQLTTNIVVGAITADATLHASAFCQHLRPGYLLGGRPRSQAIGHMLGIVAGTFFCIPVFYHLFLRGQPANLISDEYPFPAAVVWIGVAKMLTGGSAGLPASALAAAAISAALGIILSLPNSRIQRLQLSPIGIGLAFLIPFHISLAIFSGALCFWACTPRDRETPTLLLGSINEYREPICAGLMAGTALAGLLAMTLSA